jgi:hypothetical protein
MAPSLCGSGPVANFAKKNIPGFQATLHLLSILPPEIAQKIGRENVIRLYRLK